MILCLDSYGVADRVRIKNSIESKDQLLDKEWKTEGWKQEA